MTTDYTDILSLHDYAIIDRVGLYEEPWHKALPMTLLMPKLLRSDAEKMPALLPLGPQAPYLEELAEDLRTADEHGFKPLVSTLLTVPPETDPARLHWHLTACVALQSPQGRATLRYYDPLVFLHLDRVFNAHRYKEYFYGSVVSSWTLRFQKGWVTLPVPEVEDYKPNPLGLASMLLVDAPQREGLDRIGAINLALALWREKTGHPWPGLAEWRVLAAQADACIAREEKQHPDANEDELARNACNKLLHNEHGPRLISPYMAWTSEATPNQEPDAPDPI